MVKHNRLKSAFTLVELIIAIVIIAMTVLSLPMMNQVNQKGIESNIVQEAIFAASAELMGATTGYWDANSMQDINVSTLSRVISIGNDCNATTKLRPGHINQAYHRRCLDDTTTNPSNATGSSFLTLDDAGHSSRTIFIDDTGFYHGSGAGYKNDYNSSLNVSRTNDTKFLTLDVTDTDGNLIVRLRSQSANVGEIDFYKKRMF